MNTFTNQSNARRAAKKMLAAGTAPGVEFGIYDTADGRFAIAWAEPPAPPSTAAVEREIATATAENRAPAPEASDADPELAEVETERLIAELARRGYRSTPARVRRSSDGPRQPRRSKAAELDEAAGRGVMPEKPIVTSATNQRYQHRFDKLAALAADGDWNAIAAYEVKGKNTYAKDVARYRDRLLAAHAVRGAAQ